MFWSINAHRLKRDFFEKKKWNKCIASAFVVVNFRENNKNNDAIVRATTALLIGSAMEKRKRGKKISGADCIWFMCAYVQRLCFVYVKYNHLLSFHNMRLWLPSRLNTYITPKSAYIIRFANENGVHNYACSNEFKAFKHKYKTSANIIAFHDSYGYGNAEKKAAAAAAALTVKMLKNVLQYHFVCMVKTGPFC